MNLYMSLFHLCILNLFNDICCCYSKRSKWRIYQIQKLNCSKSVKSSPKINSFSVSDINYSVSIEYCPTDSLVEIAKMHLLNSIAQLRKYSDDKYIDCNTTYKGTILCSYFLRQYTALKIFSLSNKCMNMSDQTNARGAIEKLVNILYNHVDIEIANELSEFVYIDSEQGIRDLIKYLFFAMYVLYKLYQYIRRNI